MSTFEDTKRSRYDVTISQAELEKNMSNCFGFDVSVGLDGCLFVCFSLCSTNLPLFAGR